MGLASACLFVEGFEACRPALTKALRITPFRPPRSVESRVASDVRLPLGFRKPACYMAMRIKIEEFGKPRKYKRRGCSATGNYEHLKPYQFHPGKQLARGHNTPRYQQRFDKEVQTALLDDAPPELRKMAGLAGKRCVTTIYALVRVLIRLAGTGELDALLALAKLNDSG